MCPVVSAWGRLTPTTVEWWRLPSALQEKLTLSMEALNLSVETKICSSFYLIVSKLKSPTFSLSLSVEHVATGHKLLGECYWNDSIVLLDLNITIGLWWPEPSLYKENTCVHIQYKIVLNGSVFLQNPERSALTSKHCLLFLGFYFSTWANL